MILSVIGSFKHLALAENICKMTEKAVNSYNTAAEQPELSKWRAKKEDLKRNDRVGLTIKN